MKDTNNGNKGTIADLKARDDKWATDVPKLEKTLSDETKARKVITDRMGVNKAAVATAKLDWDAKKKTAGEKLVAADAALKAIKTLRDKVVTESDEVVKAQNAAKGKSGEITIKAKELALKLTAWQKATIACQNAKYDQYQIDLKTKQADRDSTLKAIEKLIDQRKTYTHGATGGRCEKPQSNGDNIRRAKCTAETDCCGAATGRPAGATGPLVTIEVCQPKTQKTWSYVAPRAPLAVEDPTGKPWPFKCIGGASKLAGVAAAAIASAYMMA